MQKWQDPDIFLIWIIIILGFMLMLVGTLIAVFYLSYKKILKAKEEEHAYKLEYQRSLLTVSLEAQESERIRIAADLHDNIISKLTIIRLKAAMGTQAKEIDHLLGTTIDESRRISHELSPPMFEEKNLESILLSILNAWQPFFFIQKRLTIINEQVIDKNTKLQLVRIFQELLNNVYKHAKASAIFFSLRMSKKYVILYMCDNGKGFDMQQHRGLGLRNIELRADNLKAAYKFKSLAKKGTRFIFVLTNGKN